MRDKHRVMAEHLVGLMNKTKRPRNQVAAISGLTNTYIRDLEGGKIANVPREKLIALSAALNLDLNGTDRLLTVFDRAMLSTDDIPAFLHTATQVKISTALLPVRDAFAYELIVYSGELIPGPQIIVNYRPTAGFMARGHHAYSDRTLATQHKIYSDLFEAIAEARRNNIRKNLAEHPVEHYICKECLEDYLNRCPDPVEKSWRVKHIAGTLNGLREFPNLSLYLTGMCTNFHYTLKVPHQDTGRAEVILFSARAPHDVPREKQSTLAGFSTENQIVIQNFKDELETIKDSILDEYRDRDRLTAYLEQLILASDA